MPTRTILTVAILTVFLPAAASDAQPSEGERSAQPPNQQGQTDLRYHIYVSGIT